MTILTSRPAIWKDTRAIDAPELMSAAGANGLAARIHAYWQKRGYTVRLRIETTNNAVSSRDVLHCVRSDMIGGMPR